MPVSPNIENEIAAAIEAQRKGAFEEAVLAFRQLRKQISAADQCYEELVLAQSKLYKRMGRTQESAQILLELRNFTETKFSQLHPKTAKVVRLQALSLEEAGEAVAAQSGYQLAFYIWLQLMTGPRPLQSEDHHVLFSDNRQQMPEPSAVYAELQTLLINQEPATQEHLDLCMADYLSELSMLSARFVSIHFGHELSRYALYHLDKIPTSMVFSAPDCLPNYAQLCKDTGNAEQAIEVLAKYLDCLDQQFGEFHDLGIELSTSLAQCFAELKTANHCQASFERALSAIKNINGDDSHPDFFKTQCLFGEAALRLGDYGGAEKQFKGALRIAKQLEHFDKQTYVKALYFLGQSCLAQRQFQAAETFLGNGASDCAQYFGSENVQIADFFDKLADVYQQQRRFSKTATMLERSLHLKLIKWTGDHEEVRRTRRLAALAYRKCGRYLDAESVLKRLISDAHPNSKKEQSELFQSELELGKIFRRQGRFSTGDKHLRTCLERVEDTFGFASYEASEVLLELAYCSMAHNRFDQAEKFARRVSSNLDNRIDDSSTKNIVIKSRVILAFSQFYRGNKQSCEQLLLETVALSKQVPTINIESILHAIESLCEFYAASEQSQQAAPFLAELETVVRKASPHSDLNQELMYARVLEMKGKLQAANNDCESAINSFRKAIATREYCLERSHPSIAVNLAAIGLMYEKTCRYDIAESYLQNALQMMERTLGPHHKILADTLIQLAAILSSRDRTSDAVALSERALKIYESVPPSNTPVVYTALGELAAAFDRTRRRDLANAVSEQLKQCSLFILNAHPYLKTENS